MTLATVSVAPLPAGSEPLAGGLSHRGACRAWTVEVLDGDRRPYDAVVLLRPVVVGQLVAGSDARRGAHGLVSSGVVVCLSRYDWRVRDGQQVGQVYEWVHLACLWALGAPCDPAVLLRVAGDDDVVPGVVAAQQVVVVNDHGVALSARVVLGRLVPAASAVKARRDLRDPRRGFGRLRLPRSGTRRAVHRRGRARCARQLRSVTVPRSGSV